MCERGFARIAATQLRGSQLKLYLLVAASDGYRAVFALPEFDPDFTDQVILLADGVWGAKDPKVRLTIAVSGVSEGPELAPGDRFGHGERVPPQHVDVLVAERR